MEDEDPADIAREAEPWTLPVGAWELATIVAALALAAGVSFWLGERSGRPSFNDSDVGFVRDMTLHHDQAVEMALIELDSTDASPDARTFVREVLLFQRYEIGYMEALLDSWGQTGADPDVPVMGWMGRAVRAPEMPGLASEDEMNRLESLSGSAKDLFFLELMAEHHGGGVGMAEAAAQRGQHDEARALAKRIAKYQRIEIGELAASAGRIAGDEARQRVLLAGKRGMDEHDAAHRGH